MSLRDLVAGSDVCTPGDGGGPSNAVGSLANTLLGTSKVKDGLQELPGIQQGGPSSSHIDPQQYSLESVAQAAVHGDLPAIPGLHNAHQVPAFRSAAAPSPGFREFDEIYSQQIQPPRGGPHGDQEIIIGECFKTFMRCGEAGIPYTPTPLPTIHLSMEDKCRIADRAMVMSRQLFAEMGPQFAEEQAFHFLASLGIHPHELPAVERQDFLGGVWNNQMASNRSMESAWQETSSRGRSAADHWQKEFSLHQPGQISNGWVEGFSKLDIGNPQMWASDFNPQSEAWASDFRKETEAQAASSKPENTGENQQKNAEDVSAALIEQMSKDPDPKFRNSKFLQFVSKMSRGEIIVEGNEVVEVVPTSSSVKSAADILAEEFNTLDGGVAEWAKEFAEPQPGVSQQWAGEFGSLEGGWLPDSEIDEWVKSYGRAASANITGRDYVHAELNPFIGDAQALMKGRQFFGKGVLTEAALAVEAEVQANPENAEAWRLLGIIHAENDDDVQAIAAFSRAREIDPSNLEVLLSMAVSHANELDESETVRTLTEWLFSHPKHGEPARNAPSLPDPSQQLAHAVKLFESATHDSPQDAELYSSLGVLQHMGRDFEAAVMSFEKALELKPDDYSLWNKLGATMANSGKSARALQAYQRALDIKPNYMRGWTNLGISHANLGDYNQAVQFYLRALSLNPKAEGVWGYLRTSLLCAGQTELMQLVESNDLPALKRQLGFQS
ncbi:hypothetical protein BSKO_10186 [Bryopsis sp. KO-2023]|nr:hypothetical protein BSKO_10186 [Bryopsis sp. KO-2023]